MVDIHENYRDYVPPAWVRATVERLLASLSAEHVGGLESIVLTNSSSLRKGKTGRVGGRKYRAQECRGFYHPAGSQVAHGSSWWSTTLCPRSQAADCGSTWGAT